MTDTRTEVQKAYDDTKPYLEGEKLISADALIKTFKRVFSALFSLQARLDKREPVQMVMPTIVQQQEVKIPEGFVPLQDFADKHWQYMSYTNLRKCYDRCTQAKPFFFVKLNNYFIHAEPFHEWTKGEEFKTAFPRAHIKRMKCEGANVQQ
jgi:hypothetical protein